MIATAVHHVAHQLAIAADGVIPNPPPAAPPGAGALTTLMAWFKYGMLACCFIAAVAAGGMIPLGHTSRRAELAERGKLTLLGAIAGAVIIAIAAALISTAYSLG